MTTKQKKINRKVNENCYLSLIQDNIIFQQNKGIITTIQAMEYWDMINKLTGMILIQGGPSKKYRQDIANGEYDVEW